MGVTPCIYTVATDGVTLVPAFLQTGGGFQLWDACNQPIADFSVVVEPNVNGALVTMDASPSLGGDVFEWDDAVDEEHPVPFGTWPLGSGVVNTFQFNNPGIKVLRLRMTTSSGLHFLSNPYPINVQPVSEGGGSPDPSMSWVDVWNNGNGTKNDLKAWFDANTGPVGSLTVHNGPLVTTHDGQVIEDLYIHQQVSGWDHPSAVSVLHSNVTIRNCHVFREQTVSLEGQPMGIGNPNVNRWYGNVINIASNLAGFTTVENVSVDGDNPMYGSNRDDANGNNVGIKARSPVIVDKSRFVGCRAHIQCWQGAVGSKVYESLFGEVWRNTGGVSTAGTSFRGTNAAVPPDLWTRFERNFFELSAMAGASLFAETGRVRQTTIKQNYISGTSSQSRVLGYGLRGGYSHNNREHNRDIQIEENRFDPDGNLNFGTMEHGTNGAVNINQTGNTFINNRFEGSNEDELPKITL